jgi:hypothetical protein
MSNEKKKRDRISDKDMEIFRYQENLRTLIRDLKNIDRIIPSESSRHGCLVGKKDAEAAAIIEARKSDLLGYIQTVCRDHILWGSKLLKQSGVSER